MLTDQGNLEEAETRFRDALRVARAAKKPYVAATAVQHLGRVAMLGGDPERGFELLGEARAQFDSMRNADDVEEVDMLLAECHLLAGDPSRALQIVRAISAANPTRVATLERTRGRALLALGHDVAARHALEVSLADAREQDAPYEIARTLDTLVVLDVRAGDLTSAEEREAECTDLLRRLGVRVEPELRISLIERDTETRTAAGTWY